MSINLVHVYLCHGSEKLSVGRLGFVDRKIFFEYDADFMNRGIELSPFKLPLKAGLQYNGDLVFDQLFGVFNDSLPDGWGRLLLDRKLMQLNINPGELSPLDRLCYVGQLGMGALIYEPASEGEPAAPYDDLDQLASEAYQFQESEDVRFIDHLLALNGSSGGARPKVVLKIEDEDWLIKFRSSLDPKDIGPIEYAYHQMAAAAGLDVPVAKLFPSQLGPGYFGVQRFDRQNGQRQHMHTMSGLLHIDHRLPSLDYESIIKATAWLTKDAHQCEQQFRAAVFNVLSHNRDDHAKNFSFLMDAQAKWRVSPAYDLTFSSGPAGEHCTMVCGEGKQPTRAHLLKLAQVASIDPPRAIAIIDEVSAAIAQWSSFSVAADVSTGSSKMIQAAINRLDKV